MAFPVDQQAYELSGQQYATYAIEYQPGFDDAYITWVNNNQAVFTVYSGALAADNMTEIAARPVSQEPMYIIMNLGMSSSFITIDYDNLQFPAKMRVDYVRVYQEADKYNVGCDPENFPTGTRCQSFMCLSSRLTVIQRLTLRRTKKPTQTRTTHFGPTLGNSSLRIASSPNVKGFRGLVDPILHTPASELST